MTTNLLKFALRILLSIFTFIGVTFFVAWLLEEIIYFSLFVGIPVGIVSSIIVFVILTRYQVQRSTTH
ncbi:MAG: hypothetical protein EFT35_04755 [Methanophagales archaeon ANME-1-THS]|nr:MAG: hypothetical protein EFT35_04755 [Methanophagales archaeon ANME-1-THS]